MQSDSDLLIWLDAQSTLEDAVGLLAYVGDALQPCQCADDAPSTDPWCPATRLDRAHAIVVQHTARLAALERVAEAARREHRPLGHRPHELCSVCDALDRTVTHTEGSA